MTRVKQINRVFLITVLVSILGSFAISIFPIENYFITLLCSQAILILPMLFYILITKQNLAQVIRFNKVKPVNAILAIIFAYLISPFINLLNAISLLFSTNMIEDTVTNVVEHNPLVLSVFVIAFIPCIFEESVYRGGFFNEYRKVNPLKGILLSGFLFGLMHMNLNQFIYAFAMGTIFACMIEATDSIVTTMIIHFTINANSVVLTYLLPYIKAMAEITYGKKQAAQMFPEQVEYTVETLLPVIISYAVIAFFATILAVLLFILMAKIEGRWEHVQNIFGRKNRIKENTEAGIEILENGEPKERLISFALVSGIVICIGTMLYIELAPLVLSVILRR